MKKLLSILLLVAICFSVCACGQADTSRTKKNNTKTVEDILNEAQDEKTESETESSQAQTFTADNLSGKNCDVDLTSMNSTMVYSEVNNMMVNPDDYIGKTIKMKGQFSVYNGQYKNYFACVIADATACCSQGIEFTLQKERKYPEEYPETGTEITVIGEFETYLEDGKKYCQLKDALIS